MEKYPLLAALPVHTCGSWLGAAAPTTTGRDAALRCNIGNSKEKLREKISGRMPSAILDAGLESFESALTAAQAQGPGPLFLLFLANRDPALGRSWCPDCVRAEPVIYKTFENSEKKITLLRAYVGDRPTWRNPAHPWRLDKRFELKGVPTLILWKDGKVSGRLEDNEAHLEHRVDKLLKLATGDV